MRTTEAKFHLYPAVATGTGAVPVRPPFFFLAQKKFRTIRCATPADSARQRLIPEATAVNSQLQEQYHLHPKFLQLP